MGERGGGAGEPYEDDILGWSEDQAARLRRVAAGEARPEEAGVDWANVVDEIEGVGRFCRYTVFERLFAGLRLVLMAYRWPDYQEAGRWLAAADSALVTAQTFADPGMEGRLDLDGVYRDAREVVEGMRTEGHAPRPLPATIPLGFRDLRGDRALLAYGLLRRVAEAAAAEAGSGAGSAAAGEGGAAEPR